MHSYLDFCHDVLPSTRSVITGHPELTPDVADLFGNVGEMMSNTCQIHRHNELVYLDKTAKNGACEECLHRLIRSGHELMPIPNVVREVQVQLSQVEKRMTTLHTRKRTELMEQQNSLGVLKADRETFAIE